MRPAGSASAGDGLRVELGSDIDSLRGEWTALAERSGSIFATWEWASLWSRHLGAGRPLYLATCRDRGGAVVAIVPLYLASRRPLRVIRLVGHGPGDELGPVCDPKDRGLVAPALRTALDLIRPRWHVFVGDLLPHDPAWEAIGARRIDAIPSPALEIGGMSWEEFFESRSSKFRQQLRRSSRRLEADHSVVFRLAVDPDRLDADLDALFSLHDARWREQSSGVFAGAEGVFQREFAHIALERGWLRLWLLELDGKPAAARLGFRFGRVEFGYQAGRDPTWDKFGVGFFLQAHAVREAMNDGIDEFRFLRGGESYKGRFSNAGQELETVAAARGFAGRPALAAGRAVLSLPAQRRAWLTRLAGGG